MSAYNHLCLVGNLTKDPELRYMPSGKAVANIRLAVGTKFKVQGEAREEVLFIDVCVFGASAEAASTYLKKGRPILAEGRLRVRDYKSKDGTARKAIELIASRWLFMGTKPAGEAPAVSSRNLPATDPRSTALPGQEPPPAEPVDDPQYLPPDEEGA